MSISSSTNEWPQVDEVAGLMASSGRIMEKPTGQEQALKCPRCDSSNTKFCYYNNYSLSQPRHFCKACKRYWTRGGTLRNVPVGGGCRKNKRVKRSSSSSSTSSSLDPSSSLPSATNTTNASTTATNTTTTTSSLGNQGNPLFYGIPNSSADINLTLPSFQNIKNVPSSCTGYDLQPHQFSDLGLGFTSAAMTSASQVQDVIASNPLLSSFNSLLGSNSSCSSTCPLTTPLVASTFQQQQNSIMGDLKNSRANRFQALLPFRDLQTRGQSDESNNPGMILKELKVEEANNKAELYGTCQNPVELFNTLDSSYYWNNTTNFGSWPDLTNYGSSVTPLI